jgi:hypothetical protein
LLVTEEAPVVRPFDENAWALTAENFTVPVNVSVTLLHALHARWAALLNALPDAAWCRTYYHPLTQQTADLWYLTGMYAWHGRHHVAQITTLREQMGW